MRDDVIGIMKEKLKLKQHGTISERIIVKIRSFIETFIDGAD